MLDDTKVIAKYDPSDSLGFAFAQASQLQHDFGMSQVQFKKPIEKIVVAGMGGSALSAELATTWPELNVPMVISKDYNLPNFVDEKTLVVCSSYSGNTEETLEALEQAEENKAQIVVLAHGGKLGKKAEEKDYPYAEIPESPQPRMGAFYSYRALCEVLVAAGAAQANTLADLDLVGKKLEQAMQSWRPEVLSSENLAKQIAADIQGKTPIIYAGPKMYPAAYKWKISANENAKNTAWCNYFPELNHNEFIGWSSHPPIKPFALVNLVSDYEHERNLKRFEVTEDLLKGLKPKAIKVEAKGDSELEHMLYLVLLGDAATLYLAILNEVDPTPVNLVEDFKKALN